MTKRSHGCSWCSETFSTITAHMVHVHESHPETIGRGHTRTRTWSCWRCAKEQPATSNACPCGFVHPYMTDVAPQDN